MTKFNAKSVISYPDRETSITITELDWDAVEFVLKRRLFGENGIVIRESETKLYPSMKELRKLLDHINNAFKEYDDSNKLSRGE